MKLKGIAAILAFLIGLSGYAVVDEGYVESTEAKLAQYETVITQNVSEIHALESEVEELQAAQIEVGYKGKYDAIKNLYDSLLTDYNDINFRYGELTGKYNAIAGENTRLISERNSLLEDKNSLTNEKTQLIAELNQWKNTSDLAIKNAELIDANNILQSEKKDLQERVDNLEKENKELKTKLNLPTGDVIKWEDFYVGMKIPVTISVENAIVYGQIITPVSAEAVITKVTSSTVYYKIFVSSSYSGTQGIIDAGCGTVYLYIRDNTHAVTKASSFYAYSTGGTSENIIESSIEKSSYPRDFSNFELYTYSSNN